MTSFAPALLNPQDFRRALKQQQFQALQPNQLLLTLQTFPRLGAAATFYEASHKALPISALWSPPRASVSVLPCALSWAKLGGFVSTGMGDGS